MVRPITLLFLFICVSSGTCDDQIIDSPRKTFKIIQHGNWKESWDWTETLQFTKGHHNPIVLEYGISWPARFYISPDEQWILRIQKSGSGDNISYLYRLDANHRLWRMEQQIGELAFDFIGRETDLAKLGLYHTGIEFASWDLKSVTLHFTVHASFSESGKGLDRELIYNLRSHSITAPQ